MISTSALLDVSTLGRFELHRDHNLLSGGNWNRRKVCDLFKLLLSAEQHRLHREQIQEILWPTSSIEQAANSFGKTLYLLRRALEPDLVAGKGGSSTYVLLDHDTLMLTPERMEIDADLFEASAKQLQARMRTRSSKGQDSQTDLHLLDEFDAVLALYKGDYLPEDLYEDWAQRRRDRLRRVYSWLLENAAKVALANAQAQRAGEYLQALLEGNPADEQTHRQLMLIYARMGRRSDALNQYQLLQEALREELDAQPLPETTELFRRIQSGHITVDLAELQRINEIPANKTSGDQFTAPNQTHKTGAEAPHTVQEAQSAHIAPTQTIPVPEPEAEAQSQIDPDRILKAELVGREEEIATMQRAYSLVRQGRRKAVFICGEPGIGKTRLAREFTRWGEGTQQAIVLWGYCYEMSGSFPYQPIADAISAYVRMCSPEQLRRILGNSAVDLAKIAPEVRFKLPELPQPEPIGPELERRNLYMAVGHFFQTLAAGRPLIIILDDLQWADAATMQLLNFLMTQSAGVSPFDSASPHRGPAPLYLMLYRAGEVHETHPLRGLMTALARAGISEDIRLQRLSEAQVQQLLINMAGHFVRPVFAGEIYRQTEGNPFFIGEAIRSLVLEGKLKRTGERWQATVDVNKLEIPQSVRLVIERRLAHLPPECRTTLTLAAVLGRQFSSALLCQARNLSEDEVAEHIDDAIQAQILCSLPDASNPVTFLEISRSQGNAPYERDLDLAFTHDKIREVLYQWLNPLRRRTLHRQVAQAIEARYTTHLLPYYSTLGYHYQLAENSTQAVDYLLKAAGHAASVYAFVNAAEYIKIALDLLIGDEERPRRAELLRQLSEICIYTGRPDKAIEAGIAAATLWRDLGEVVKEADARLFVAFCYHWQGLESVSIEHIQHALKCLESKPGEVNLHANAYAQWGLAATVMGNVPLARQQLQKADELQAQVGESNPFAAVVSLWARSWCAFLSESPRQMLAYAMHGAEVCRASHNPGWEPMMIYSAAWAHMQLGQLEDGQRLALEALQKAQQHGAVGAQSWAHLIRAFLAIQAGHWEEASKSADSAYAIASQLNDADLQARVLWSRSVCAGWQDDWQRAIADIKEAMQLAQRDGEILMVFPYLLLQAARAYSFAGQPEEAQIYLDQAMQLGQTRQYGQLPAVGQRLQGRIWQAQGRFDEAQPCFERSLDELLALDDQVEYARTQEAYGLFYLEHNREGDEQRGQELLRKAKETFQRLGVNA
ncbi:MAG: AAA family ATPase [Ktedonobacteraceae bacterium]